MAENTAVIANGGTASQAIPLAGAEAGSVQMPAAITGTALTIKVSNDGVTFTEVVEEGAETNPITVGASGTYPLPIKTFSAKYMQLIMDAQGRPQYRRLPTEAMTTIADYILPDRIQWTFQDAVERLLDNFGEMSRDGRNVRIAKEAVLNAYDTLARSHEWRLYVRRHIFKTDASYSTGTVVFDYTGGVAERIFTLTGGTWPTTAAFGYVRIGTDNWPVARRISSTVVQIREDKSPSADIASTAFEWYRNEYPYPLMTWRHGALVDAADRDPLGFLSPASANEIELSWNSGAADRPTWYTVRGDGRYLNNPSLVFIPPPNSQRTYEFSEQATGWPLTTEKLATGTVTVTAASTTATVSSAVLTSNHIGCIMRFSASSEEPTSLRGGLGKDNPYQYQRVIQSVTSTTACVLDSAITAGVAAKPYTVSSPIDIDSGPMLRAFWSLCEWEFCQRANRDAKLTTQKERQWNQHLLFAQDADRRIQQIQSGEYDGDGEYSVIGEVDGVP